MVEAILYWVQCIANDLQDQHGNNLYLPRMFKKAVRQGHSKREGEAHVRYVAPLSDARMSLAAFSNICKRRDGCQEGLSGAWSNL
jgi:hypothetical protein